MRLAMGLDDKAIWSFREGKLGDLARSEINASIR
jgi:hypothetical protein